MITVRTKLYFMASGFYVGAALLGALANAVLVMSLGIFMSIFCWYNANWMMEQDILAFLTEMAKRWPKEEE